MWGWSMGLSLEKVGKHCCRPERPNYCIWQDGYVEWDLRMPSALWVIEQDQGNLSPWEVVVGYEQSYLFVPVGYANIITFLCIWM